MVIFAPPATRSRDSACAMCYMAAYTGKMQVWLEIGVIGPLQPNISVVTVPVRKEVSTDHLYETTYPEKNNHVTDDVT